MTRSMQLAELKATLRARIMSCGLPSMKEELWRTAVHELGHAVALPPDPLLLEGLRVYSAFTNQSGKLQCVSKDDLKRILGRSPDRMDSVLMACCGDETDINFARVQSSGVIL